MMTSTSKFDDLLTHLGTGPWNMLYFFASSFWCLLVPPQFLSGVYLAPAVNYTCLPPEGNETIILSEDSCSYIKLTEEGEEVKEECREWLFDDSVFTNTLTSEFSLVCEKSYLRATYQSIYMLGTFLSPIVAGYLADRYGRKVVVVLTQVLILIFSTVIIFFTNFTIILVIRFLLGACNVLTFFIYALEVCEPKHRGTVGILTGLPWALGTMVWGGMAYLIRDWRWLQLSVSLPNLLILLFLYAMDESPRWLIVRGHHNKAMQVLHKAARWNHVTLQPEPQLRALMTDIQKESMTSPTSSTENKTKKWYQRIVPSLLRTRLIQIITIVVCVDYFAVSFVFDGLNMSGEIYSADPFVYLVLNGLVEVPGYSLTAPIIERWGRKIPTAVSYVLSSLVLTAIAFIPSGFPELVMTLALAGKVCISGAYQIIYVYSSELFPTEVRLQGIGAASVFAQLASTIVPFITSILGPLFPWLPSLTFGIIAAVAGVATLALRETKGVPLPDTLADLSARTTTTTAIVTSTSINNDEKSSEFLVPPLQDKLPAALCAIDQASLHSRILQTREV